MKQLLEKPVVRKAAAVGGVLSVIAGLIGTLGNLQRVPEYVCMVPGIHMACGSLGVGKVASDEEESAWKSAQSATAPGDIRAYLAKFPEGIYVDAARTRLATCRSEEHEAWTPETRSLPLYVPASAIVEATVDAAREAATRRATAEAATACAGFVGEFRVRAASAQLKEWSCRERDEGSSCAFDGFAVCELDSRGVTRTEVCR